MFQDSTLSPADLAFIETLRRAMVDHGQIVDLGPQAPQLRFLRRGQEFEESGTSFEAIEPGLFMRCTVESGQRGQERVVTHRWVRMGYSDDADLLLGPLVRPLSERQRETVMVGLAAQRVLQGAHHRPDRSQAEAHPSARDTLRG